MAKTGQGLTIVVQLKRGVRDGVAALDPLNRRWNAQEVSSLFPHIADPKDDLSRIFQITLPPETDEEAVLRAYGQYEAVEYAHPVAKRSVRS